MSDPSLRLFAPSPATLLDLPRRPVGRYLVDAGLLDTHGLLHALALQKQWQVPLGEILVSEGLVTPDEVLEAVAAQNGLFMADLDREPPDAELQSILAPEIWAQYRVVPWMRMGDTLVLATAWPDQADALRSLLPRHFRTLTVVAPDDQVERAIANVSGKTLALRAETRVEAQYSCRTWEDRGAGFGLRLTMACAALVGVLWFMPVLMAQLICIAAILTLVPVTVLKLLAFGMQLFGRLHDPPPEPAIQAETTPLPRISVMVPLFHETEIAHALIARLKRLDYPKALLEVVLVLEAKDDITRATIDATDLPHWMRAIEVPTTGSLTTKPRAMNYALDFCRGDLIGVWDAEDAPLPDQLHRVAAHFAQAAPEVACVQGVLDYYNPRSNWLARCFTIEYAGWWRVLLPGVARLGLVLPLGGTTLFFRRDVLEKLGAWDAHNVTEDADLGMRLAREGYRTELVQTVTHEEANCRALPWVKQRSRWLKGFMVTWLVHMRQPRQLYRQLGLWRMIGVHTLMAGTVAQFVFAPILWSLWLLLFDLPHPMAGVMGTTTFTLLFCLCVAAELGNLAIAAAGVARKSHRFLLPFVPTMPLYYVLGTFAALKAIQELLWRPFFWDKTQHGISAPDLPALSPDDPASRPPAAAGS